MEYQVSIHWEGEGVPIIFEKWNGTLEDYRATDFVRIRKGVSSSFSRPFPLIFTFLYIFSQFDKRVSLCAPPPVLRHCQTRCNIYSWVMYFVSLILEINNDGDNGLFILVVLKTNYTKRLTCLMACRVEQISEVSWRIVRVDSSRTQSSLINYIFMFPCSAIIISLVRFHSFHFALSLSHSCLKLKWCSLSIP